MAGVMTGDHDVIVNSDSTLVSLGDAGAAAFQDGFWYMAGRLLASKAKFPGFKGTIATIWRVKSGLTIQDAGERFVFQFDSEAVRNRILHGGPWFYRNTMLVVGEYDGICPVEDVSLNTMEAWVAVRGLPFGLRNKNALALVGASLGTMVRMDLNAVRRKEEEQRIKIMFDVRRRIRTWKVIEFSPVVKPELSFIYEKVNGFCRECGLFLHDVLGCDKQLIKEKEEIKAIPPASAMAGLTLTSGSKINRSLVLPVQVPKNVGWSQGGNTARVIMEEELGSGVGVGVPSVGIGGHASLTNLGPGSKIMETPMTLEKARSDIRDVGSGQLPVLQEQIEEISMIMAPASVMSRKEVVKFSSLQVVPVGRKRKAVPKLDRFGKKYLAFPDSTLEVEDNVSLGLQHKHGKIWVSPKKKKVGRPKGSKNKVKSAVEQDDTTIRKYKCWGKALSFDSTLEDNVHVKVGKPVTVLEETNVTAPALELAAVEVPVECEGSHSTNILV